MDQTNYKGNPNLKPAAIDHAYTTDEVAEFIKCQKNPAYFICLLYTSDAADE